ncbi:MAG: hypothetical protein ACI841_003914 [Planctomycetota bacterium]|jgi:hypothetical protein
MSQIEHDWTDAMHRLIFFCACLVYCPLVFGLITLRAYIDYSTQRILRAVSLGLEDSDLL